MEMIIDNPISDLQITPHNFFPEQVRLTLEDIYRGRRYSITSKASVPTHVIEKGNKAIGEHGHPTVHQSTHYE
jgi:hypothetical protein